MPVDFYMKQTGTLDNACGIIACLHAIFNNLGLVGIIPDSILDKFYLKAVGQTPEERAATLEVMEDFKEAHKEYAAQGQSDNKNNASHHFVAFTLDKKGQLVEFDGTKKGPLVVKERTDNLVKDVSNELLMRIQMGIINEQISVLTLSSENM
mmetsp:Transcript_9347/g.7120  ORF Transcript_9347/g.7120 Transcript_9347/m.7120 type:complete len:152 (+) Transcript_9347:132-587(+)